MYIYITFHRQVRKLTSVLLQYEIVTHCNAKLKTVNWRLSIIHIFQTDITDWCGKVNLWWNISVLQVKWTETRTWIYIYCLLPNSGFSEKIDRTSHDFRKNLIICFWFENTLYGKGKEMCNFSFIFPLLCCIARRNNPSCIMPKWERKIKNSD